MTTLADREAALVAALEARFPGHRVRAALAPWPASEALEPHGPGPELRVSLRRWREDGALEWLVQAIETDLRSASARRTGAGTPAGLFAVLDALREGADGYAPQEARPSRMDDAAAAWDIVLLEAAGDTGDPRPPMLAYRLTSIGTTTGSAAPGATSLPGIGSVAAGARLLAKSGTAWRDLGCTADAGGTLALPLEEALPSSTSICRAHALPRLPEALSAIELAADASAALAAQQSVDGSLRVNALGVQQHVAIARYRHMTITQYREAMNITARLSARHPLLLLPGSLVPFYLVSTAAEAKGSGAGRSSEIRGTAYTGVDLSYFLGVAP
jgi:hypothetical protein